MLRKSLLVSTALLGLTGFAHGQTVSALATGDSRVVSFGDSLSDAGNVFSLTGGIVPNSGGVLNPNGALSPGGPPTPGSTALFGAFSTRFVTPGGLTTVEQLLGGTAVPSAGILDEPADFSRNAASPQSVFFNDVVSSGTLAGFPGAGSQADDANLFNTLVATSSPNVTGNVNLATGGAFAGSGNLGNIRADLSGFPGEAGFLPGVNEQINAFAAAGGTITSQDIVTYWAGANNLFAQLPGLAASTNPLADATAIGTQAATFALGDITNLSTGAVISGGGAGQVVVFNLPNLGLTPSINPSPTAAAGAGIATNAFNNTLSGGIATLATTDTNTDFALIDVASLFDAAVANPAAFGFTNVTDACLAIAECANDPAVQATFAFADGVHPTNRGYELIAALASQVLDPTIGGNETTGIADAPLFNGQFLADRALSRATSYWFDPGLPGLGSTSTPAGVTGETPQRGEAFAEAIFSNSTVALRGVTPSVETDLYGARIGADIFQSQNTVVGFQGAFTTGNGSQNTVEFEPNTFSFDLYGSRRFNNAFAAASIGGARVSIDNIERNTGIGGLINDGSTEGFQFNSLAEVGYIFQRGDLSLVPSAQIGYFHTSLNGYSETGVVAPLTFGERDVDAVSGAVNLRIAKAFTRENGLKGNVFAGVGYEEFLHYDADNLNVNAIASTAAPTAIAIDDPDGRGFVLDLGGRLEVNENFSLAADYAFGFGGDDTRSHRGTISVITRF